ncbi:hypothetical protein L1049_012888 [Liquidambar formosana]|uniref:CobW/HypB/UreG nucleotide-binding domain-containing protein n=1 Tax=Liquidambar formosana TaxID=63359 RepID=A0AAP0RK92_LIQFO
MALEDHDNHDHHHHHDHNHDHRTHEKSHGDSKASSWVGPDGRVYHSHDGLAPHSHEPIYCPGYFTRRAPPLHTRDFNERAYTIGIGGPVGTSPGEFQILAPPLHGALPEERIRAIETGGCPHVAIREDISINLGPLEEISNLYKADKAYFSVNLVEVVWILARHVYINACVDNLVSNFSRELADYIIYIIDVFGGDKIPWKGGPSITQADLLVINKIDLARAVGANLAVMERDALRMRDGGPFVFAQVKHGLGIEEIIKQILQAWEEATGNKHR